MAIKQSVYLDYFNSLLEGNKSHCSKIVTHLIDEGVPPKEIYTELFQKSMYQIGRMWDNCKINVANEHLATTITESLISTIYPVISKIPKNGKKAIIACIDKEFHDLGAKIISDFFEINGWNTYYLGANMPIHDFLKMVEEKQPQIIGLSFNFYMNLTRLTNFIEEIGKKFPEINIIVGGQGFNENDPALLNKYKNVKFIENIDVLENYLNSFNGSH